MTLIDTLVGMAVMATGVVGIMYGFSAMETSAAVSTDQARLQTEMRQMSDFVRSRDSLPYVLCGTSAGYTSVIGAPVNQLFTGGKFTSAAFAASGDSWSVQSVGLSTLATRTSGAVISQPAPLLSCGATLGDWGVQEITLKVSSASRSLTRVVWKGKA
jgi:hypothetical protein